MINEMLFNFLLKAIYMKSYCTKKKREKKKKPFLLNNKVFLLLLLEMFFIITTVCYPNDCCFFILRIWPSSKITFFVPFWLHFYAKFAWQMIFWMHPTCDRLMMRQMAYGWSHHRLSWTSQAESWKASWHQFIVANLSHFLINPICIFIKDYKPRRRRSLWRRCAQIEFFIAWKSSHD